jgi:hypothetical protein
MQPCDGIAYAISICEIFLIPNNLFINMSEKIIKPSFTKNYVSFWKHYKY